MPITLEGFLGATVVAAADTAADILGSSDLSNPRQNKKEQLWSASFILLTSGAYCLISKKKLKEKTPFDGYSTASTYASIPLVLKYSVDLVTNRDLQ
nr:hypothetical protein [uncultured Nitrososphaera sp.]